MSWELRKYNPQGIAVIACYRNFTIGWSCLVNSDIYLFVNPKYRKRGVGRQLLHKAIKVRTYKRYDFDSKHVQVYWSHNRPFYKKMLGIDLSGYYSRKIGLTKIQTSDKVKT